MSGINDLSRAGSKQMEAVRRQQERELKFVRDTHDTVKTELKKANEADLVSLQHENQKQLSNEHVKKEKLLENIRTNLHQTKELTDRELAELEVRTAEEKNKLETKLSLDRERLTADNELYLEDINHRFNTQGRKIQADGRQRITDLDQNQREIYESREHEFEHKIAQQRDKFSDKYLTDEQIFKKTKAQQDKLFKADRMSANHRQHAEIEKMNNSHETYKRIKDSEFKKDITGQELFFEKRYGQVRNKHEGDFQRLNELSQKIINDSKKQLADEVNFYATRSEDPFYKFTELRPTLTEKEDSIKISVPVPEHSKADIMLTMNNKDVVLNFNRRYVDVHKDQNQEKRINKVETLTTKISTGHHLDAKSLKSHYEDGIMTYTIKKA